MTTVVFWIMAVATAVTWIWAVRWTIKSNRRMKVLRARTEAAQKRVDLAMARLEASMDALEQITREYR